jgi:Cysteine-rich CWC
MYKHEEKSCPRCSARFECKVGDITNCQCYGIELTIEEEAFVASQYNECLCRNCLLQLKQRYTLFVEKKVFYVNR